MSMCNQYKIDVVERSDFILASFENRIRQPGIDEQNFSARRCDLESRLAVPGECMSITITKPKSIGSASVINGREWRSSNDESRSNNKARNRRVVAYRLLLGLSHSSLIRHSIFVIL